MTEAEWLKCPEPNALLFHFPGHGERSKKCRKLRLFSCACCRHIWGLLTDPRSRHCVEVSERFADGLAPIKELQSAWEEAYYVNRTDAEEGRRWIDAPADYLAAEAAVKTGWDHTDFGMAFEVLRPTQTAVARSQGKKPAWDKVDYAPEAAWQASTFRDIFGPLPFRLVAIEPSWLAWTGGVVVKLAQAAYDNRTLPSGTLDSARLAVLADALEEAGCTDADLLGHLHSSGPHVRGCWVLDLLLGRE